MFSTVLIDTAQSDFLLCHKANTGITIQQFKQCTKAIKLQSFSSV